MYEPKLKQSWLLWLTFIFLTIYTRGVVSSPGDRDMMFQYCLDNCIKLSANRTIEWYLHILQWDKESNCKYECMHEVTQRRIAANYPIMQYYGKWPFVRLYGIEDPASFFFSLFNLFGNIYGWLQYTSRVGKYNEFYGLTKTQVSINCMGWVCASVFHARDTYWTEKMDYFSAALVIAISIFTCYTRIIGKLNDIRTYIGGIVVVLLFGSHISYMAFVKFDYGYNMKFMILIGAINVVSWMIWCALYRKERPHVWKCMLTMGGTGVLALLELLDFPPIWGVFDGHSLWHLGTAPLSILWFSFLIDDDLFINEKYFKLL